MTQENTALLEAKKAALIDGMLERIHWQIDCEVKREDVAEMIQSLDEYGMAFVSIPHWTSASEAQHGIDAYFKGEADPRLIEAARAVVDGRFSSYKVKNGRDVSIDADDGEKVYLVHSELMFELQSAYEALKDRGPSTPTTDSLTADAAAVPSDGTCRKCGACPRHPSTGVCATCEDEASAAIPLPEHFGPALIDQAREIAARYFENDPLDKARKAVATDIRKGGTMDYQDATQIALYALCHANRTADAAAKICGTCGGYGLARGGACWTCGGTGKEPVAAPTEAGEAEPSAWTGSGSMAALKDGREGFIWPSKADAHPIPLYALPPGEVIALQLDRKLGMYGSAYDPPGPCRAYTYVHQPSNLPAYSLGQAHSAAAAMSAGDNIDRGLGLLKALEDQGFGVFEIEREVDCRNGSEG